MTTAERTAFEAGRRGHLQGATADQNPYPQAVSRMRRKWYEGWLQEEQRRTKAQ
jgi:hypothetical protein